MATEIKVPALGESVTEATVAKWLKKIGDSVAVDDPLVELETDKVTLEVNATAAGTLGEGGAKPAAAAPASKPAAPAPAAKPAPVAEKPKAASAQPATAILERSGPAVRRL